MENSGRAGSEPAWPFLFGDCMGRKTKLTPELQAEISELLAAGAFIEDACDAVGIGTSTFYDWMRRGERDWKIDAEFSEFSDTVKKARARAAVDSVGRIRKAGEDGTWQADAWYLERSYPERWGRRRVEVSAEIDGTLSVDLATTPEWKRLRSKILKALEPYPDARAAVVGALSE